MESIFGMVLVTAICGLVYLWVKRQARKEK